MENEVTLTDNEIAVIAASLDWCIAFHDLAKQNGKQLSQQDENAVEDMKALRSRLDKEYF